MSFSSKKAFGHTTCSAARIGKWILPAVAKDMTPAETAVNKRAAAADWFLSTPASVMYTRYGHIPYLSEDVVQQYLGEGKMSHQRLLCMSNVLNMSDQISKCGDSRKFLGVDDDAIVFVSQLDPTEQRLMGADTNSSCGFQLRGGRRSLQPSEYLSFIQSLQVDFAPFIISTPNSLSTASALRRAVERSASHANLCRKLNDNEAIVCPASADSKSETQSPHTASAGGDELMSQQKPHGDTFMMKEMPPHSTITLPNQDCPVLATANPAGVQRQTDNKDKHIEKKSEFINKDSRSDSGNALILGPSIDCSFSTEHISMQISKLGHEILSCAPVIYFYSNPDLLPVWQFANIAQQFSSDALKILIGASRPDCLLDALSTGFDVFDNAFCYALTERRLAFVLDFENINPPENGIYEKNKAILNCSEMQFRDDFSPLLTNCACYTCKTYTKAYLNHLIVTRELLAPILLNIHNLFWYNKFFDKVSQIMKDRDFVNFDNLRSKLRSCNFNF